MRLGRFGVALYVALSFVHSVNAQDAERSAPPRWLIGAAVDVGEVPDELSARCGDASQGLPAVGGALSLLFHARSWLIVEGDTRASALAPTGCKLLIPAPRQVEPNQWVGPTSQEFARGSPGLPLTRSALRVGVETTRWWPLLRATGGGGLIWSRSPVPFGTATAGIGTRGAHVRVYAEIEESVSRVRIHERQQTFHQDASGNLVADGATVRPRVLHPSWTAVHLGLEVPLGGASPPP